MTDTITLRDHSQPCEHGFLGDVGDANQRCNWYKWCPGGREITLRLLQPDLTKPSAHHGCWVEVTK